jgi:hypothetical protein
MATIILVNSEDLEETDYGVYEGKNHRIRLAKLSKNH